MRKMQRVSIPPDAPARGDMLKTTAPRNVPVVATLALLVWLVLDPVGIALEILWWPRRKRK